ncbi:MAG: YidC/Oxa1 family membrane protein insertase [Clostridiales bacterium]|nr:YidC/Oxa1 family membrane protein insertase [Clostridiales bacterium]
MGLLAGPFGALLKFIFDIVGNYGLSIIIFAIVVKLFLVPLTIKQTKSMEQMSELQPKIKEIQEKYKNDKEKINIKTMELYKEHKINPFGGCLPMLIQLPVIFGMFTALRNPGMYVFGSEEIYRSIDTSFLWLSNLSDPDLWILPITAGITTYFSSLTMATGKSDNPTQKMMLYMMPVMIIWWGRSFPAGLTLYWVISNLFQAIQQVLINKPKFLLDFFNKGE